MVWLKVHVHRFVGFNGWSQMPACFHQHGATTRTLSSNHIRDTIPHHETAGEVDPQLPRGANQ